jgi:hypothetical protein
MSDNDVAWTVANLTTTLERARMLVESLAGAPAHVASTAEKVNDLLRRSELFVADMRVRVNAGAEL